MQNGELSITDRPGLGVEMITADERCFDTGENELKF
jgi:hypothetical protein